MEQLGRAAASLVTVGGGVEAVDPRGVGVTHGLDAQLVSDVYDDNLGFKNAWPIADNINFIQGVDKDGKPIGRRDMSEGKQTALCPAINGGMSWNSGSYNPKTGLYYKVGNEWCMDLEIVKTTPVTEPMVQLNIGANFTIINPPECAILGVGKIVEKPVARGGQVVIRPTMWLSLTFDHRIVDGKPAADFLRRVQEILEKPYLIFV